MWVSHRFECNLLTWIDLLLVVVGVGLGTTLSGKTLDPLAAVRAAPKGRKARYPLDVDLVGALRSTRASPIETRGG
ncbi:hypothetical protein JCM11251_005899 [Rhodosporidiobolus azoricus]